VFSRARTNPSAGAVLLDAMGTLVTFAPPAPRLAAGLREALGVEVAEADAARAVRAEIAYYRAHLHEGADAGGLARVRLACARVVRDELGLEVPAEAVVAPLLDSIVFVAYPDAAPALRALRAAGRRLVVASNWDVSLHEALDRTGLAPLLDGAVASAEIGSAKPAGAIFARALELAGEEAAGSWHAGDSLAEDVEGAMRAGLRPVLVDRAGRGGAPAGVPVIASLAALPALAGAPGP
jgi:putative hydrolase of the HAD superfamily